MERSKGHRRQTSVRHNGAAADSYAAKPNEETGLIIGSVDALSEDGLLSRYHELIDKRFADGRLPSKESFELKRIQARLDAEDRDEVSRLDAIRQVWDEERRLLLASIESLLKRLKLTPQS